MGNYHGGDRDGDRDETFEHLRYSRFPKKVSTDKTAVMASSLLPTNSSAKYHPFPASIRCQFCYPFFLLPLLGLLSGVKPHLKLLALVIPYSGNPRVRYDIVFSLGPFYINKNQFCYPCFLLTSKGDFGVKAPPQTCQQSIFGILMAPQINPWGQTFWPSSHE